MKLVGLMCTKNESDIIELVVRHHLEPESPLESPLLDVLVVVDDSTDTTPVILAKLIQERLPIIVMPSGTNQARYLEGGWPPNRFARKVASQLQFDWLVNVDSDEFLQCTRGELEAALSTVPDGQCCLVSWQTWVPLQGSQYYEMDLPLSMFRPRTVESYVSRKGFIPFKLCQTANMVNGGHYCSNHPNYQTPILMAHLPVRNSEQIVIRETLRSSGMNRHPFLGPLKNYEPNMFLRDRRFRLSDKDLFELGCHYCAPEAPLSVVADTWMRGSNIKWKYPELALQNIAEALESRMEFLINGMIKGGVQP